MTTEPGSVESVRDFGSDAGAAARRWRTEIDLAKKDRALWTKDVKKITKRFRDARTENDTASKFNILWSNVQTLGPAIYSRMPKPTVERRFMDRDPVGRTACRIMENVLNFQIEAGYFHRSLKLARDDYLLTAQGVAWIRYEPTYGDAEAEDKLTDTDADTGANEAGGDESAALAQPEGYEAPGAGIASPAHAAGAGDAETSELAPGDGMAEPQQEVLTEKVCVDYVHWSDYLCSPARVEDEVTWKARRSFLTRGQLTRRFTALDEKQIAAIPLDHTPSGMTAEDANKPENDLLKKATVWEIWDKADKKVIFLAEQYSDAPLEVVDDPLHLQGFWPTPMPVIGTTTNDTVVPVPDYIQYRDQAQELDDLTTRIGLIISAIRVAGVYDSSWPILGRMLDDGGENKLYPCDSWAAFGEKGGIPGAMSFLPIKEMSDVLVALYQARQQVKADLYEVTGISDIVRGSSEGGAPKTATEQRIKGQFANLRLTDRQGEMARFARDTLEIMGEIIAEHFSAETLYEMSGFAQWGMDEHLPPEPDQDAPEGTPMPPPGMGHNGGPPMDAGPPPPQAGPGAPPMAGPPPGPSQGAPMPPQMPMPAPVDPMVIAKQKADAQFAAAVKLLKDQKLRGFRIDIESDSTVDPDPDAKKQSSVEFLTATAQFLTGALPIAQAEPQMLPLLGKLLLFGVRGFRAGRELETAFEETVERLDKAAAQPKPQAPSPEEMATQAIAQQEQIKVQSAQQQAQFKTQALAAQAQVDQASAQQQQQLEEQKFAQEAQLKGADHQARLAEMDRRQQLDDAAHQRSIEKANLEAIAETHRTQLQGQAEADKAAREDLARRAEFEHVQVMRAAEITHTQQKHALERTHLEFKAGHEQKMMKTKPRAATNSDGGSA